MKRIPIRIRLTLLFASIMTVSLLMVGGLLYLRLAWSLDEADREDLNHRFSSVATILRITGPDGLGKYPALLGGALIGEPGEEVAQVLGPDGSVLRSPEGVNASLLPPEAFEQAGRGSLALRLTPPGADHRFLLLAAPVETPDGRVVLVAARSLEDRAEALSSMTANFTIWGPVILALSSLLAYVLARAALRPVEAMRRDAAGISVADLQVRLRVPPTSDEIQRLGSTLNEMLDRLQASVDRERAFLADASHELRTPLSLLKTELDLALHQPRSEEELRRAVESAAEETDRLIELADDLLVLARADQGRLPIRPTAIDVPAVLESLTEGFRARAERQQRRITIEARPGLVLLADETRLEQALRNLLENALRHGSGTIAIRAKETDGEIRLHVTDEGPGFPPAFLPRAFQRFSRADTSRGSPGSGLGLAIARAIAEAHGGRAEADNQAGAGADVWVSIPAARQG